MTEGKNEIPIKTPKEIEKMLQGGRKLARVKKKLKEAIKVGVRASDIEKIAVRLIDKEDGRPSFKMVPKYNWATCVNVDAGVVHGIPNESVFFRQGNLVSVDLGMFYKGFHTDTSFSVGLEVADEIEDFLETGKKALEEAIAKTKEGNRIFDISKAIETTLRERDVSPIKALVGHGIGRELHEKPQIPCFTNGKRKDSPEIHEGVVVAIEVMYAKGNGDVCLDDDGWTISTRDGTISALFEETVAATKNEPVVLTQ
jgi:methionyl aminopeptidase